MYCIKKITTAFENIISQLSDIEEKQHKNGYKLVCNIILFESDTTENQI